MMAEKSIEQILQEMAAQVPQEEWDKLPSWLSECHDFGAAVARIVKLEAEVEKLRELLKDTRVALLYSDKGMRKTLASIVSAELEDK